MLEQVFWGNSVLRYIITGSVLLVLLLAVRIIAGSLVRRFKAFAARTVSTFDDFIAQLMEKVGLPALYLLAVYCPIRTLVIPPIWGKALNFTALAFIILVVVRVVIAVIGYGLELYVKSRGGDTALEKSLQGIMVLVQMVVWSVAVILFLDNLGFKITAVIAGLGIGGVAVALAAQAVLKDIFSYFCILFDRPFKVGDFVIVGDYMGAIEYVGIKTTRIRSLSGEILVFSNSDLTESRLRNYGLMQKRRVAFSLGVVYQTALKELREIPEIIKKIITAIPDTAFDRCHFSAFGDFSLKVDIVYYINGSDFNKYMDIQQKINLEIKEEFEKRRIEFAYPTQSIVMQKS